MAVARPNGYKIDFVRNPISGSAAWFFVIILKFIFKPIFEIKIHEKNSLTPKKVYFRRPIFINQHIFLWSKSQDRQLRQYLTPPAWELSFCQKFKVTKHLFLRYMLKFYFIAVLQMSKFEKHHRLNVNFSSSKVKWK